ncbi:MAG: SipW-dependent-type signal peptide-containing protein [Clostridia bacterium]
MNKKLITAASIALAACVAIGGTIAYLTDKTDTITNTFTVGKVDINLTETARTYKMIPGTTLDKDPTVTVEKGSEDSWVFVKVEESENLDTYIDYTVDLGVWTPLEGAEGVYYVRVAASEENTVLNVLTNNQVSVLDSVTSAQMAEAEGDKPTLTFTAYAIQAKNGDKDFTAAEAWAQLTK